MLQHTEPLAVTHNNSQRFIVVLKNNLMQKDKYLINHLAVSFSFYNFASQN